ncbi:hypothetical protein BSK54_12460 [Paenibacillus odorifer]|nr:hypothetical protein BSK54_12460 [Paenibacillus odorifer]
MTEVLLKKNKKTLISQGFHYDAEDGGRTRTVLTYRRILSLEVDLLAPHLHYGKIAYKSFNHAG